MIYYYTAVKGRKNVNGHHWTRGRIYYIVGDRLEFKGYSFQSGGENEFQAMARVLQFYKIVPETVPFYEINFQKLEVE